MEFFRTKKDMAIAGAVSEKHSFLETNVGFCPINVRRKPFASSRLLQQSPSLGESHE
jgi:hypothetical protein